MWALCTVVPEKSYCPEIVFDSHVCMSKSGTRKYIAWEMNLMKYDLILKGGHVFAPQDLGTVDVAVKDGKITALGEFDAGDAEDVLDVSGKLLFPGVVETHAHMMLPLAGTVTKNDFYSGTVAGAYGGVTTLIDFADQKKGRPPMEIVQERMEQAAGKCVVDYSFHCTLTDINENTLDQMTNIVNLGITSFKFYTIYKDDGLYVDDGEILRAFEQVRELGAIATVHCENEAIVRRSTEALISEGKVAPRYYPLSKPEVSEVEAIRRVIYLARQVGVPLLIRHVSSEGGVKAIREAKRAGQIVYGETCPPYLTLTNDVYQRDDGQNFIVHPPIREAKDMQELWRGLADGTITIIGTDDCAFTREQKKIADVFYKIPGGLPGIEVRLSLMFSEGVLKNRISLERLAEITSTNPAKVYNLFPRKGAVMVGSDADLVVFDPEKDMVITGEETHDMADWSPFEGWKVKGVPSVTISKGKVIMKDGKFFGKAGDGSFLARN